MARTHGRDFVALETVDIGLEGLFIETHRPLRFGDLIHIEMEMPSQKRAVPLRGAIVHLVSPDMVGDRSVIPGIGVQFYGLGRWVRRCWMEFFQEQQVSILATSGPSKPLPSSVKELAPGAERSRPRPLPPVFLRIEAGDVGSMCEIGRKVFDRGKVHFKGEDFDNPPALAVLSFVHPRTEAEFHVSCNLTAHPAESSVASIRSVTELGRQAFELFAQALDSQHLKDAVRQISDRDSILIEAPEEVQLKLSPTQPGVEFLDRTW